SVIVPARNEEARIENTLLSMDKYLRKQDYAAEVIVIDNGSNDLTFNIVKRLAEDKIKSLRVVEVNEKGKGGAVAYGIIKEARGEYIMFMDADNATPLDQIESFWPYFSQGYDVVIGSRYLQGALVTRRQPLYRIVLSRLSNLLIQLLAVPGIADTQLGFKVFLGSAARKIFAKITVFGWGFDMEVLTIARVLGYRIKELPVLWREQGGSHVPLKAYLESLADLVRIKLNVIRGIYQDEDRD
ncbi:MAG: glycosyltransferase family 2 protein, partial [Candidatus Doudnabacteria bacterium]|nr:glycosyltransferase family 2 protein [Candidatus Doudnabacteria bacterium]